MKCFESFEGDKRATLCADCAYSPEQTQQDAIGAFADTGDTAPLVALLDDDAFWVDHEARMKELEAQEEKERLAKEAEIAKRRVLDIPSIYRVEFEPKKSQLPKHVIAAVREWMPSCGKGLGLTGTTGLGKTRLLVRVLMRLKCSWLFLPSTKFAKCLTEQYEHWPVGSEALAKLKTAKRCDVLLLDDVGQENATQNASSALYDLIEYRTSEGKPILWTCNLSGEELANQHKTRGPALVRRLREFSIMPGEQE